jgi:hypothetical protein
MTFSTEWKKSGEYRTKFSESKVTALNSGITPTNIVNEALNFRGLTTGPIVWGITKNQDYGMHPEFWGMRNDNLLLGKFDGLLGSFPKFFSRPPQATSEDGHNYSCNFSESNSAKNIGNVTDHNTPPKRPLIILLFLLCTMGISYMACPFLMQEEKDESTLKYIIGWILISIAFFAGCYGYYLGGSPIIK